MRLGRCHSLFIVVAVVAGISVFNSVLYQPHLEGANVYLSGIKFRKPDERMETIVAPSPDAAEQRAPHTPERSVDLCAATYNQRSEVDGFDGHVLCQGSKGYKETTKIFNSVLKIQPKLVLKPIHEKDVVRAMQLAVQQGYVVTVKDGGHNPAGFSLNTGGMVIDMKHMNRVTWSNESKDVLRAQGGTTWEMVHVELKRQRRGIVGGGCPQVGVVGLALGGGIGWTSRSKGLVSDNLLAARIVFPNGTLTTIHSNNYPELLWALRGAGGSNFGVVTEVMLRTFPVETEYFAGTYCFSRTPHKFRDILLVHQRMINGEFDLDNRLTMDMFMSRQPPTPGAEEKDKEVRLCWSAFFDGPIPEAILTSQKLLSELSELVSDEEACMVVGRAPCHNKTQADFSMNLVKPWMKHGGPWKQKHTFVSWAKMFGTEHLDCFWKSVMAETLTDEMVDATISIFSDVAEYPKEVSDMTDLQIAFEHLGGEMQKKGSRLSAWKHGNARVMGSIQSFIGHPYNHPNRSTYEHYHLLRYLKNWTDSYYEALAPSAQGCYGNYADSSLKDWSDKYYGVDIYGRLKEIKKQIPGTEIFSSAQRIGVEEAVGKISNQYDEDKTQVAEWRKEDERSDVDHPVNIITHEPSQPSDTEDSPFADASKLTSTSAPLIDSWSKACPQLLQKSRIPIEPGDIHIPGSMINARKLSVDDNGGMTEHWGVSRTMQAMNSGSEHSIMKNQRILLTGGSQGLGWSAVLQLANVGASVVYTSRSKKGCDLSLRKMALVMKAQGIPERIVCVPLELGDFESVYSFVARAGPGVFDTVILNAGAFPPFSVATKAGNTSASFAVNNLGNFILVHELLKENRINSNAGKIVVVFSFAAQRVSRQDIEDLMAVPPTPYQDFHVDPKTLEKSERFLAYGAAKAINFLFALELADRLKSSGSFITVTALAPAGTSSTNLIADVLSDARRTKEMEAGVALHSMSEGALGMVYLASKLSNEVPEQIWKPGKAQVVSGCTLVNDHAPFKTNAKKIACIVWKRCLKITGLDQGGSASENLAFEVYSKQC